ncbi:hypothetical protein S40285_07870 [Stachybotrys chlorohalonatus IBT 40285]|uniref:MARVEL domain-containing protein n=1 Tax=Stachybotrys chlorohalonatus (strain IBT 40285) TaxID=1283841 RepID=A0A084Q976_STAC4|nr:hypothetical protein S40285_07870 [Stachybotrys chlorohalonata IBT 40285]
MVAMTRLAILLPLALSIVAIVLSALCLFAGHQEGFMEDYAIARLNTSMVGHGLFDITSDGEREEEEEEQTGADEEDGESSWFDDITGDVSDSISDTLDDVQQSVEDTLNDVTGSAADAVAEALGLSEWFSIHVMTACEGMYRPNATANNAGLNTTDCTSSSPDNRIDLDDMIAAELSAGPLEDLSLEDINWPEEVQTALDMLNGALLAVFIFYVLTMAFSGLLIFTSVGSFFAPGSRALVITNLTLAALGAIASTVASTLITVAVTEGINELNRYTDDVGIRGERGNNFLIITWVTTACMLGVLVFWSTSCCLLARQRRRAVRSPHKGSY